MNTIEVDQEFKNYVELLPNNVKNKIYIIAMKQFWRQYYPLTAKVPSWYPPWIKHKRLMFDAAQNNIHFMHLPCNTLEENKIYIPGCQCNYCTKTLKNYKQSYHLVYGKETSMLYMMIKEPKKYNYLVYRDYMPESTYLYDYSYIFNNDGYICHDGMKIFDYNNHLPGYISLKDALSNKKIVFSD